MAKSKKYNVHAIICPNCKGNGYIKLVLEEGREHVVAQCPECDSEGEFYEIDDMGLIDDGTSDSVH